MTRSDPGRTSPAVLTRLSVMMFLQYAIWGAWLPLFWSFLKDHRSLAEGEIGNLFAISAVGALIAPFVAGQIADRWFNTEWFLGLSHLAGAVLVWQLATVETYQGLLVFGLLYSFVYAPTLSLTNSLAFHHLADRDREFGKVRVWGTIGWIVVGIGMGQWLLHQYSGDAMAAGKADAFRLSAILGAVLGVFCFTLPATPPQRGTSPFAALKALGEVRRNPLLTLFLIAFPISCVHQFYFVHTVGFLDSLQVKSPWIDSIFGVGGGPMTIGQIAEIVVLAVLPFFAARVSRKTLLKIGLVAYILRFAAFSYLPTPWAVYPALALHGVCFGCFFFIAFMVVDEHTTSDVRASAQSLFSLIVFGFGIIVGNLAAGFVAEHARDAAGATDYQTLFAIPMWVAVGCLVLFAFAYPAGRPAVRGAQ